MEYNGKAEKFIFRKLTFGEKNRLREDSTEIKIMGGQELIKVSMTKLLEGSLLRSLIKAPFPVTQDNIQNLDAELGEKLVEIVTELNNLSGSLQAKTPTIG